MSGAGEQFCRVGAYARRARASRAAGLVVAVLAALATGGAARADTLVYHDGDRVGGTLVKREGDVIVFSSARFGEIRVSAEEATVELETVAGSGTGIGEMAVAVAPTTATVPVDEISGPAAANVEPAERKDDWWEPWEGRLAFSTELVWDSSDKVETVFEMRVERKWENDEVRIEPRYEFKTDNGATNTDLWKVNGYARHDLPWRLFVQYVPYYELNREYKVQGLPFDYELIQQQVGAGVRVVERPGSILRVGVAESWYFLRIIPYDTRLDFRAESVFVEAELEFPWRVSLRDRGQWLTYSIGGEGWTNDLEITKQLTDTWLVGLRYELRKNAPELRGADYTKLRMFFGLNF